MGADFVGWRDCSLQRKLGPEGFLQGLKMRSYRSALESQVPAERLATVQVTLVIAGQRQDLTYDEICRQAQVLDQGTAECADCPLANGQTVGCYCYVSYPVDETFERLAFEFFCSQLDTPDSISDQLYRDLVSRVPAAGTAWHEKRGEDPMQGALAVAPEPLFCTWDLGGRSSRVDSAQLLSALFVPLDSPALVVGYARFWNEFQRHVNAAVERTMDAHGLRVDGEGNVEVEVSADEAEDPAALSERFEAGIAALQPLIESRTLGEIASLAALVRALVPGAIDEGWRLLADS
jgi:hypothetical protein